MSEYLNYDCINCGRHRVENNGICEKCNFDNILNEFAQPVLECLEHGAGTCRNADLIGTLRAEIARLKEENHALDQINRDIQTAAAHLDEVLAELARRDEIIARLKEDAERLADGMIISPENEGDFCSYCGGMEHVDDCPITLHRALMKELAEC